MPGLRPGLQARVRAGAHERRAGSSTSGTATRTAAPPSSPTTSSPGRGLARYLDERGVSTTSRSRTSTTSCGRSRERSPARTSDALELDARDDARARLRHGRPARRAARTTLDESRVWRGASRAEMESRLREGPPAGPTDAGGAVPPARDGRPSVHRPARPSALLRLHAELPHLAGRPRGLPRERRERLRRNVAPVGRPEHDRADRHRLVPPVDRLRRPQASGILSRAGRSPT